MDNKEIANQILKQLGGNKFIAMVGPKYLSCDEKGALSFRFPGCKKANHLIINLNKNDYYNLTFYKISGINMPVVQEYKDISCENLQSAFKSFTGLNTSL